MHEIDETRVKEKHENEIVLAHLPKVLWVKMEKELPKQYPGAKKDWFPMKAIMIGWSLDQEARI